MPTESGDLPGWSAREREIALDELAAVLARTDDPTLIKDFLQSILTSSEVSEVATRWALVRLMDGGMSQRQISRELGLSLCKITRGSKELKKRNSAFKQMITTYRTNQSTI
ncbi:MAG TPA: Trp family transcriptional regulator [Spirochaetia bacterium]|nr:Trp family transcriptional regulator [Spirochaetia bacterium]